MLTRCFMLTSPMRFEISIEDVDHTRLIATPEYVAISDDDINIYQGKYDYNGAVQRALPLCLLRAAVGRIMLDPVGRQQTGSNVILIPPRNNGYEGFSQELINLDDDSILPIPEQEFSPEWVFTDAVASACSAVRKAGCDQGRPLIWGANLQAYVLAAVLSELYGVKPVVICEDDLLLSSFGFAEVYDIRAEILIDDITTAYITASSPFLPNAIEQSLQLLQPRGILVLGSWLEGGCAFSSAHTVNKELRILGSSVNAGDDYIQAARLMGQPGFRENMSRLVLGTESISSIREYYHAFEAEAHSTKLGKAIYRLAF